MIDGRFVGTSVLFVWIASLTGCGGPESGPVRYAVDGAVGFAGKPLAAGSISFTPNESNYGGGSATIKNGRFDTRVLGGRGHLGGPHAIRIVAEPPEDWDGGVFTPPFAPYVVERDLPSSSLTIDFEIPERATELRNR